MRTLIVMCLVLATGLVHVDVMRAQEREHHLGIGANRTWNAWRGRDVAYLTAQLGSPDSITGARWRYENVRVGRRDGPYTIWTLTFVIRRGQIATVRATYVAGVGCDLYE